MLATGTSNETAESMHALIDQIVVFWESKWSKTIPLSYEEVYRRVYNYCESTMLPRYKDSKLRITSLRSAMCDRLKTSHIMPIAHHQLQRYVGCVRMLADVFLLFDKKYLVYNAEGIVVMGRRLADASIDESTARRSAAYKRLRIAAGAFNRALQILRHMYIEVSARPNNSAYLVAKRSWSVHAPCNDGLSRSDTVRRRVE